MVDVELELEDVRGRPRPPLLDDRYEEGDFKSTSNRSSFAYSTKCVVFSPSVLSEITLHGYHPSLCCTSMELPTARRVSVMLNTVATAGVREGKP